jgi:hypothetical protein
MKRHVLLTATALSSLALAATADAGDSGWFVGASGGFIWLQGDSDTTNGGGPTGGGGTAHDVDFDNGHSYGAMIGTRVGQRWSLALSYDHVSSDVSFLTTFNSANPSYYEGSAESDVLLLNAIYSAPFSDSRFTFHASAGAGVTFNSIEDMTEDFTPFDGVPNSLLDDGDKTGFAGRVTVGLSYALDDCWALHGEGSIFTLSTYETGDNRTPQGAIVPYELDAWGYGLTFGVVARF